MRVSLLTVTFNSAETLASTLTSCLNQRHNNIEHVIIDGGSTDKTLEIVKHYDHIDKIISEPDEGIYDALNKGIKVVSGDIVGLLHSDDLFYGPNTMNQIVQAFSETKADMVYGDLVYVDRTEINQIKRYWRAGKCSRRKLLNGWMPPHTTIFVKREVYEKYGLYRLDLGSAADYEWILRILFKYNITAYYLPEILMKMRIGGISNRSLNNRLKANMNDRQAWQVNGLKPKPYTTILKPLRKLPQFWRRPTISNSDT